MNNLFKNKKIALALCAALILGGYAGYKYYTDANQQKASIKLGTVMKGNLSKTISATGSLSAVDNVDISSKITGRIVEVFVKENQHVNAGDILVKLDDTALTATRDSAAAKLEIASLTLNRNEKLKNTGAISQSSYDTAYSDYLVALNAYNKAASDVADTVITTPIDGYIIGKPTPVGQTISSGISTPQVIMSVATLDKMQIETLVDESDIGQVQVGQKVRFTVDAFNNETFTGKVRLVSRKATTTNNVVYYTVYVDVDDAKGKLLPTMTARSEIIIEEANDVVMVPTNCIYFDKNRRYVKIYNEKTKETREVDVKLGLSNDNEIAVSGAGLQEGDKLVVKKAVARQAGTNIRPPRM